MRVLNKKQLKVKTGGLADVTIWRLERSGKFPKWINLTSRRVGWIESEVDEWLQSRPKGICAGAIQSNEDMENVRQKKPALQGGAIKL